jgi:hypothetical protein
MTPPLFKSGDSAAGVSAAGFALVFLVETLGIIKLVGLTGFQLPDMKGRHALDARWPEKLKLDFYQPCVRGSAASIRQGKFRSQLMDTMAYFGGGVKSDFSCAISIPAGAISHRLT